MTYAYDERLDGPLHDHDKAALVRDFPGACCPTCRCCTSGRPAAATNATASPPTASSRWWSRCPRPRRRWQAVLAACHALACRWWRAAPAPAFRAARCRTPGVLLVAGQVQPHPRHRSRCAHRRACSPACATWPSARRPRPTASLRARSLQPDRLHDRRQRRRELRRRALPEVRPDAAQRAEGARLHRSTASAVEFGSDALDAPGSTCWRC